MSQLSDDHSTSDNVEVEVLSDRGSNPDLQIQNLSYYHYTIGQKCKKQSKIKTLIYNFYKHYAIEGKRKITGVNRFFPKTPPGVFFATKDAQVYCLQALHTTVICGALENYVLLLSICRASFKISELIDLVKEEEELMKHTCNNPPDSIWP
jgi:hypothetical protein